MEKFIQSLRHTVEIQNWHAAMCMALTLPDICASIDQPGKNNSSNRYATWFSKFVGQRYKWEVNGRKGVFMTGSDCYALRCAYLHQGTSDVSDQRAKEIVERFVLHHSVGVRMHCIRQGGKLLIDMGTFCNDIAGGAQVWLAEVCGDRDTRRNSAVRKLFPMHLPDQFSGGMLFVRIGNPFA